jgi:signal transduction histidine kinase
MSELPPRIQQHLHKLVAEDRAPAYVLVDREGKLVTCGGQLEAYGLVQLQPGEPVSEQIFALAGLLPLESEELFLPCVQTETGRPADLYFLQAAEGDYVLFLDASQQERQQRLMQQKGNELSLNHQRLIKEIQQKEVLLHCIVHDLAGPLLGIKGGFELLANENLSAQGKKFVEIGLRQADKQDKLIREILHAFAAEVEALDSFTIDPANAPDAAQAIQEVVAALQPAFALKHVKLQVAPTLAPSRDWKVVGEKMRLERVISNLVENALRHSPPETTVTVGCYESENNQVLIAIDDEGPGVPPEVVPTLFLKFAQGKQGKGKIGLGLYFCRITIEHWGGQIGHSARREKARAFGSVCHVPGWLRSDFIAPPQRQFAQLPLRPSRNQAITMRRLRQPIHARRVALGTGAVLAARHRLTS